MGDTENVEQPSQYAHYIKSVIVAAVPILCSTCAVNNIQVGPEGFENDIDWTASIMCTHCKKELDRDAYDYLEAVLQLEGEILTGFIEILTVMERSAEIQLGITEFFPQLFTNYEPN